MAKKDYLSLFGEKMGAFTRKVDSAMENLSDRFNEGYDGDEKSKDSGRLEKIAYGIGSAFNRFEEGLDKGFNAEEDKENFEKTKERKPRS